jgi:hypothetical protein
VAANAVVRAFPYLSPEQWRRRCVYNYPAPEERTLQWLAAQTLHEGRRHLHDFERGLGRS